MIITDWEQLADYLDNSIKQCLPIIANKVSKILKRFVKERWYNTHKPTHYRRTLEVLNSITVSEVQQVGNGYQVLVYFDPSKINNVLTDIKGYFNHHMSIDGSSTWSGMNLAELVPLFMDQGQSSKIRPYSGVHFMQATIDEVKSSQIDVNVLKRRLRSQGLNITII